MRCWGGVVHRVDWWPPPRFLKHPLSFGLLLPKTRWSRTPKATTMSRPPREGCPPPRHRTNARPVPQKLTPSVLPVLKRPWSCLARCSARLRGPQTRTHRPPQKRPSCHTGPPLLRRTSQFGPPRWKVTFRHCSTHMRLLRLHSRSKRCPHTNTRCLPPQPSVQRFRPTPEFQWRWTNLHIHPC